MENVIVKVSDKGFDKATYKVKRPPLEILSKLTFKLDDSLDEATISHGVDGIGLLTWTVTLKSDNREETVDLAAGTTMKLKSIKRAGEQNTISPSGTTSGTIEVSSGVGEGH